MANDVFANGREISCKAADGKSICAFPDVCLSPPSPPAGPIPIPYPNTGMAKDSTSGSKTVKISKKEIILKNKSHFKKSMGDEAATKSLGMGVITHQIQGKVYYNSWSMDVKVEGENVVRHLDLTTHNHASQVGQTPPWPYADRMAMIKGLEECSEEKKEINEKCDPWNEKTQCPDGSVMKAAKDHAKSVRGAHPAGSAARKEAQEILDFAFEQYVDEFKKNDCHHALKCALVPYEKNSKSLCCPHATPDHIMPASQFFTDKRDGTPRPGCGNYVSKKAPCMCAVGGKSTATHGLLGSSRKKYMKDNGFDGAATWGMEDSAACGAHSANEVNPHCSKECIEAQLKREHRKMGVDDSTEIGTTQENVRDLSFKSEYITGEIIG